MGLSSILVCLTWPECTLVPVNGTQHDSGQSQYVLLSHQPGLVIMQAVTGLTVYAMFGLCVQYTEES